MLVLTRTPNETIEITCPDGSRLSVQLISTNGKKAKIGITAPRDYAVHRGEVQRAVESE